jgi:RimJ/RimL family protein N-acetyltransferase
MNLKVLETERLYLKPTQPEDADLILELFNTPKWLEHIGDRQVKTKEEAENYIKVKMLPQLERLGFSNNVIILKSTGEKVGVCGLYDREGIEGLDVGYALLPQFEKNGYVFESVQKLIETAFTDYYLQSISAITTHKNIESQKILDKLGFLYHKNIFLPNDDEELRLYVLEKKYSN